MCPDEEVLSAYVDGELSDTWKTRVQEHLSMCSRCAGIVDEYVSIRETLREADIAVTDDMIERAYHEIMARRKVEGADSFWRRKILLPLPIAAAAAVLLLAAAAALFIAGGFSSSRQSLASSSEVILPQEEGEIKTLEDVLRVFESQNAHIEIFIQLPEDRGAPRMGEPVLVREAEYKPR